MEYDVSGVLKKDGSVTDVSTDVEMDTERLSGYTISNIDDARFNGSISNNSGILKLKGVLEITYTTCCGRCLKPLRDSMALEIEERFTKREMHADEDMYIFKGTKIPLGDVLTDNFIVNIPVRNLCKDDCKGLCTVCGTDLNESDCSCDKEYINPKFEAFKSIFKKD